MAHFIVAHNNIISYHYKKTKKKRKHGKRTCVSKGEDWKQRQEGGAKVADAQSIHQGDG